MEPYVELAHQVFRDASSSSAAEAIDLAIGNGADGQLEVLGDRLKIAFVGGMGDLDAREGPLTDILRAPSTNSSLTNREIHDEIWDALADGNVCANGGGSIGDQIAACICVPRSSECVSAIIMILSYALAGADLRYVKDGGYVPVADDGDLTKMFCIIHGAVIACTTQSGSGASYGGSGFARGGGLLPVLAALVVAPIAFVYGAVASVFVVSAAIVVYPIYWGVKQAIPKAPNLFPTSVRNAYTHITDLTKAMTSHKKGAQTDVVVPSVKSEKTSHIAETGPDLATDGTSQYQGAWSALAPDRMTEQGYPVPATELGAWNTAATSINPTHNTPSDPRTWQWDDFRNSPLVVSAIQTALTEFTNVDTRTLTKDAKGGFDKMMADFQQIKSTLKRDVTPFLEQRNAQSPTKAWLRGGGPGSFTALEAHRVTIAALAMTFASVLASAMG